MPPVVPAGPGPTLPNRALVPGSPDVGTAQPALPVILVVGFDNSEPSRRALIWGADLLSARPGTLHVVYADHVLIDSDLSGFAHSEMEDARDEKAACVAEAAAEIAAAAGVPYTINAARDHQPTRSCPQPASRTPHSPPAHPSS